MELQLGLALPNHNNPSAGNGVGFKSRKDAANKRSFQEAFGNYKIRDELQMMPLLLWSGPPDEEDDDRKGQKKRNSCNNINKNEEEGEELVVGWPPIQSWRKKLLLHGQHPQQGQVGRRVSKFVKVKMEGVGIARKINLSLYNSFETLANSLIHMFATYQEIEKRGVRYTLTYQDKKGDWLIAEDVPWQTFIESVQRLEILRCGAVESRP
ncbi:auxin-responsive protein IAA29 [Citrus clementina]|nr:auxin-responsive protein IAA29 [Citrus x clementina]